MMAASAVEGERGGKGRLAVPFVAGGPGDGLSDPPYGTGSAGVAAFASCEWKSDAAERRRLIFMRQRESTKRKGSH
ncbi:hypothetical protein OSH08_00450 [Kaistia geumhonensis]|uniref:Uncharacterized protein n=1 Tax=Kaistia geumhonensis TaxID=410839 RepID=A0ABU0M8Q2_9HYPH|nr:hypothetical protein [Kaistia geumhonensis]MCX5477452.1 hypothetical protein [Kaistia geumhonensis]MDQ0517341.1 hypothetical protein [Kaistia geumhonensis]